MRATSGRLLLDTNIVIHLVRGNSIGERVDAAFGLRARSERPLVSAVSLGEALGFARQRDRGDTRAAALKSLLREFVPVDIRSDPVLDRYAVWVDPRQVSS